MIKIDKFSMASVKRTAKTVKPLRKKVEMLDRKVSELMEQRKEILKEIELWEAPIIQKFGYSSDQILSGAAEETEDMIQEMTSMPDEVLEAGCEVSSEVGDPSPFNE